jgi:hypothetical protein
MSKISIVRGKIASAFECSESAACSSTNLHRSPRRTHSFARNNPTGPAPTIRCPLQCLPSSRLRRESIDHSLG